MQSREDAIKKGFRTLQTCNVLTNDTRSSDITIIKYQYEGVTFVLKKANNEFENPKFVVYGI